MQYYNNSSFTLFPKHIKKQKVKNLNLFARTIMYSKVNLFAETIKKKIML